MDYPAPTRTNVMLEFWHAPAGPVRCSCSRRGGLGLRARCGTLCTTAEGIRPGNLPRASRHDVDEEDRPKRQRRESTKTLSSETHLQGNIRGQGNYGYGDMALVPFIPRTRTLKYP